jgi:F-type H+-transporting ATPase subunit b
VAAVVNRILLALFAALVCGLAPEVARASEPAGEEIVDILLKGLNLVLLGGVIVWFGREPIRRFFADRRQALSQSLGQAAKLLSDAEQKYAQWERRMVGLDAELAEIRQQARARAEAERARILADATASAERIRRDATASVEQELRRARAELRAEAAELAVTLAGRLLKERMTASDGERLIEDFVTKVEQAPARARGGA